MYDSMVGNICFFVWWCLRFVQSMYCRVILSEIWWDTSAIVGWQTCRDVAFIACDRHVEPLNIAQAPPPEEVLRCQIVTCFIFFSLFAPGIGEPGRIPSSAICSKKTRPLRPLDLSADTKISCRCPVSANPRCLLALHSLAHLHAVLA